MQWRFLLVNAHFILLSEHLLTLIGTAGASRTPLLSGLLHTVRLLLVRGAMAPQDCLAELLRYNWEHSRWATTGICKATSNEIVSEGKHGEVIRILIEHQR